jgi:signal transduction histidine kinase
MRGGQWLNVAALVTWLICGLPQIVSIVQGGFAGWPAIVWLTAFFLYGAALILFVGLVRVHSLLGYYVPLVFLTVQIVAALVVVMLPVVERHGTNSTPALLVIIAAQLPYLASSTSPSAHPDTHVRLKPRWIWSILMALMLTNVALLFAIDRSWTEALTFGLSMGGFMLFAAASSFLVRSEAAARDELAMANTELLGTRALLAENSRVQERLRISRDLHDTLGHHLTALSLQLDVASRLSEGKAAEHIRQAHAITRLLLGDVRDVVNRLRETSQLDLAQAVRWLAGQQAGVAIHLDIPDTLGVDDTSRAEILLRSVQEIITNTTRHAHAHNLWIRLESRPDGIALHARDDGRGADVVECGNGLTGMRERFEQYAGHVEFDAGHGTGFEIRGFLPTPATT